MAKFIIPFAHVIVSNSQAGLKAYKVRRKKNVFVIYNGFDFERLNEAKTLPTDFPFGNITDGFTNVGMVARFEHAKDYPTIIKAISRLLDKGLKAKFIAVGDGTTLDFCKKLVPAEHTDSFLFLGKRSDIDSLVPFFDICVLSTFTEGISNSIMEYMAFKRPVLATDCSGNNEIIINGQTGLLVRLKDVNDWSVKLRQLIENRHIQKSLGESGYNHLNENFQLSTMVAKYKDLYKKFS